ncbi:ABC transporter ATP-binding protein [Verminephrobacter aporrectodeae subsp. tuberculatae]|uniref:DUF4435 domain-containing protein n=1 Tax=Verminephrobacter aporrectodeae TaxID=1110389 RepID=UPI00224411B8|nr:AAA family ATPase [Verminephrobacter aporrectodeae]MCW8207353.1 ABC transporter ATP-binding protein [Verminephrobacter aporrectodeae subsp. tuberculatae]
MKLNDTLSIPVLSGQNIGINVRSGDSFVFIGPNGSGKTRLGVFIDSTRSASGVNVHRIAAHRSLVLNPNVVPAGYEAELRHLHTGTKEGNSNIKDIIRWEGKPATSLLNDYDRVLSALYAEDNDVSVSYRQSQKVTLSPEDPPTTKLDILKDIWETILPHRELVVLSGNLKTKIPESQSPEYSASEMSDGERVIFYLIGQSLLAQSNTILIFDEPELHINKSILNQLWDKIESTRPDCAFIYITHDVDFASSRHAATKYVIREYQKESKESKEAWDIKPVPKDEKIPDDVVATIIGSRNPILFVEGNRSSLDSSIYRKIYDGFTVIAVGSCEDIIHSVASFTARSELHHVSCAGLIDVDGRTDEEVARLAKNRVFSLPVSEVENLFLLPKIFLAIAKALNFDDEIAEERLDKLRNFVLEKVRGDVGKTCLRYTARRVDREIKKINLSGSTEISDLKTKITTATSDINAQMIYDDFHKKLTGAVNDNNYEQVLLYCDDKSLLSEAAKQLEHDNRKRSLEKFIERGLGTDNFKNLHMALKATLPVIHHKATTHSH